MPDQASSNHSVTAPGAHANTVDFSEALSAAADPRRSAAPTAAPAETVALPPAGDEPRPCPRTPPAVGFAGVPGYEVLGELGRGAMGVVYKARQLKADRVVALKMILAGAHAGEKELTRFRTEAEAVARLSHRGIVQVYEVGEHDGLPFFSLEYCPGGSLDRKLDGTPLDPRETARLVEQLALAVQAAHDKHVIHRDIKPANVLLDENGEPKLTDFGIAKKLDVGSSATRTGVIMGTPSYMAPEQALGSSGQADHACDIYSLGALMYDCLTGRAPFTGATALDTIRQVVADDPVLPVRLNARVPADLETICLKCLRKEPPKRYPSAGELAADLRRFLSGQPVAARPITVWERYWKWLRRNPGLSAALGLAALSLVLGTVVSVVLAVRASASARLAQTEAGRANMEADRANAEASRANQEAGRATDRAAAEATANRAARRLLGLLNVDQGLRDGENGLLGLALLRMAQPLVDDPADRASEETTRARLAAYRFHTTPPPARLHFVVRHDAEVYSARFSPDGRRFVTSSRDATARVWDAATGRPLFPPLRHGNVLGSASFSPDGRLVVTASRDHTARVWDAATGQPVAAPLTHPGAVNLALFSPDGQRVLTVSSDEKTVRVWDWRTARTAAPPIRHAGTLFQAEFSPDGRRVVTASGDRTARVWDAETGGAVSPQLRHGGTVVKAHFSPDGRRVVTASLDRTARVWEAETGQEVAPPLEHQEMVAEAIFSPDGRRVVTRGDSRARVWDAHSGKPVSPPLLHGGTVTHVTVSPDGRRVLTASGDGTARVWDAATGKPVCAAIMHGGGVDHASFSPDGRHLVSAGADGVVRMSSLELPAGQPLELNCPTPTLVQDASFSPDDTMVATAGGDGTARVWDARSGRPLSGPFRHAGRVISAAFSPDGALLVTASADHTARVWDVKSGRAASPPLQHGAAVYRAQFSPDGHSVLTASADHSARIWDARTGQASGPALQHAGEVQDVSFSPDGRRVVTAGADSTARVWNAATGLPVSPPLRHEGTVMSAAFGPDGTWVVTASMDNTARVWDARTGQPRCPALRHTNVVYNAFPSPTGDRVVTASVDGTARIWDAATGQLVTTPLAHASLVFHASISRDGRRVLTSAGDGMVRVWDLETGRPISSPLAHPDSVLKAFFSSDGKRVVTACGIGGARVWELGDHPLPTDDLLSLLQLLSGHRVDGTGASVPLTALEQESRFQQLSAQDPANFQSPSGAGRRWHQREIGECLREGNLTAAQAHYWWLVAEAVSAKPAYVDPGPKVSPFPHDF